MPRFSPFFYMPYFLNVHILQFTLFLNYSFLNLFIFHLPYFPSCTFSQIILSLPYFIFYLILFTNSNFCRVDLRAFICLQTKLHRVLNTRQYDLNEIIEKIKNKTPFELKDKKRSRIWSLRVIVSKLYYSLDYENEPQATRQKVTQLLLYHGQFSKDEIDKTFQSAATETTEYSIEFLKQHSEIAQAEALKSKEFPDEGEGERIKEIKYNLPRYG